MVVFSSTFTKAYTSISPKSSQSLSILPILRDPGNRLKRLNRESVRKHVPPVPYFKSVDLPSIIVIKHAILSFQMCYIRLVRSDDISDYEKHISKAIRATRLLLITYN